MKTVGDMLLSARLSRRLTLDDVEKATKIRKKFLVSIEGDDFSKLPTGAYTKGFVRNYAQYLGLDGEKIMAFYRRQTEEVSKSSLLPNRSEPVNPSLFRLTPTRFVKILVGVLICLFLGYFLLQYRRLQLPPRLAIDAPKPGLTVFEPRVEVFGRTDTDATVAINGSSVIVHSDGKFFDRVSLIPGSNEITVISVSRYGKEAVSTRTVTYKVP